MEKQKVFLSEVNSRQIVLDFIDAMNHFDYQKARSYVTDDFSFVGVLGTRNGADNYFQDMQKMKFQYSIIKAFSEADDVCLLYDIQMSGVKVFCCGWYRLKNQKIDSLQVVFDPRPVLQPSDKN
jgi:hypothetical protein